MFTDVSRILPMLLGVSEATIRALDDAMVARGFSPDVPERLVLENDARVGRALAALGQAALPGDVRELLRARIGEDERKLIKFLDTMAGGDVFDRAATLARTIAEAGTPRLRSGQAGYFLKKDRAVLILTERPPLELLKHLGARSIAAVLSQHDVTEVMSALRFIEPAEWMRETFEVVYRRFTADDFEERPIEVRVLGPVWREVAAAFVAKKHHNVSHLKEFVVIFMNPISEDVPGAFLRDFALLLHYFHEIEFYAKLFRRAVALPDFPDRFTSFLRGDVPERMSVGPGEWLIVQQYLVKVDPADPRLLLPRVNPEALHWLRAERDLARFKPDVPAEASAKSGLPSEALAKLGGLFNLSFWEGLDWVAQVSPDGGGEAVSFDLEDTAMSLVSFTEGKNESFTYHQREALWTRLFEEYVGGEERMEELLIENFDRGVIQWWGGKR